MRLAATDLNPPGWIRDYNELDAVKEFIDKKLEHRDLNEVLPAEVNPTAENLARFFFDEFRNDYPELAAVGVSETTKTWAWYG